MTQPEKSSPAEMTPVSGPRLYDAVITWKPLAVVGKHVKRMPSAETVWVLQVIQSARLELQMLRPVDDSTQLELGIVVFKTASKVEPHTLGPDKRDKRTVEESQAPEGAKGQEKSADVDMVPVTSPSVYSAVIT